MKLSELIDRLNQENPNRNIPIGFCNPHSHRGDYSELAFEVAIDLDVRALLSAAEYAVNQDFEGYKGGTYRMTMETECYLTEEKSRSGIEIDTALLDRLLLNPNSDDRGNSKDGDEIVMVHNRLCRGKEALENAGYDLAMCLLQSDLELDDTDMSAIAYFTQPDVMRRVLRRKPHG